jgi:hypothetical protein
MVNIHGPNPSFSGDRYGRFIRDKRCDEKPANLHLFPALSPLFNKKLANEVNFIMSTAG